MKFTRSAETGEGPNGGATLPLKSRSLADVPPAIPKRPGPVIPAQENGFNRFVGQNLPRMDDSDGRKLIVGRDISLNGTINSCQKLVVEGTVETNISECEELEIAKGGLFKGDAKIGVADIAGEFIGSITAELVILRSSGVISGNLSYTELEVERGAEISGDISKIIGESQS
jgi:cytoskeletal protein CcmA (bactofilin family)